MQSEFPIERLRRNLRPVRPRSVYREALLLLAMGIEIAAFLGSGFMRPDMPAAMESPSFWWKLMSMGLIAVLRVGVALVSINPVRSFRPGLSWMPICIIAILATGWIIDAGRHGGGSLLSRLDWELGLHCVGRMVALSIPPAVALGLLRRGTPTDRPGTALAAGFSCAAWGAFVFAFACPPDDPLSTSPSGILSDVRW